MSDLPKRTPDPITAFAAGFQHLLNEYVNLQRVVLDKAVNPIEEDEILSRTFLVYADGVQFLQNLGKEIQNREASNGG